MASQSDLQIGWGVSTAVALDEMEDSTSVRSATLRLLGVESSHCPALSCLFAPHRTYIGAILWPGDLQAVPLLHGLGIQWR